MNANVTYIIPTLKRPEHLRRCLQSVFGQTVPPLEILVGIRADDTLSPAVLQEFAHVPCLRGVEALGVGVVGSMSSCLVQAKGDFIALADDDVELPANWSKAMLDHLLEHPNSVASGGRDILLDHPEMRRSEALVLDVGRIHFYGRQTGNHHRAGGEPRYVDNLRGSNILFRGEFLRRVGFETGLWGGGAQVNWELALALQARAERKCFFFDPSIHVLHHVAPRHDTDLVHRGVFSVQGTKDIAFNETFVVLRHGTGPLKLVMVIWQLLIGSPTCPGLARLLITPMSRQRDFLRRIIITMQGRASAAVACLSRNRHDLLIRPATK